MKKVLAVLLSSSPPAKYETYIGSIGRRQGDIKVIIPSRNDIRYCIFKILSFSFDLFYHKFLYVFVTESQCRKKYLLTQSGDFDIIN